MRSSACERLCVVMPVYNEQDAIGAVLEKWDAALNALGVSYEIRPYNDGSKDDSLNVMRRVAASHRAIKVVDKPNGGHGNTVLTGYRDAARDGFDWVFQVDSDDEMGPERFNELWRRRRDFDFLVGTRDGRVQSLSRKIISFVSRLCVRLFYGKGVWDVNTPYRLMRVSAFRDFYSSIPLTTFAPNVILSGLAARHGLRCFEANVPQRDRTTGEVSIRKWKLFRAALKSLWQTVWYAYRDRRSRVLWPLVSFALSMLASPVCGRSLWIDEILRCVCQRKYTVGQLMACQNLADFDSQSPVGYLLWRPVQALLGIELGGSILSALAAALFVHAILNIARLVNDGKELSRLSCAIVATMPIVTYYGGELWFYMPWAAAYAMAMAGILRLASDDAFSWRRYVFPIVFASLFVALHFAGLFFWLPTTGVFVLLALARGGFKSSLRCALLMAVPALVNLPLYLKAQFAAAHLDASGVDFSRLPELPGFLLRFFSQVFPLLVGGWWIGVAVAAVGLVVVICRRRAGLCAFLAVVAFSGLVYTSYVRLRGYSIVSGRFWLPAMCGTLPLFVIGVDFIAERIRLGVAVATGLLVCNVVASTAVVQMEGRSLPALKFAREISLQKAQGLVCPNHYETRPFSLYAMIGRDIPLLFPSYWEQGASVRANGMEAIRRIAPLTPVFARADDFRTIRWTGGRVLGEIRTAFQKIAIHAGLFPEPNTFPLEGAYQLLVPDEDKLVADAEAARVPVFAPGDGWSLRQMPPRDSGSPCMPFLFLGSGASAGLRVYVPSEFEGDGLVLDVMAGSDRPCTASFAGRVVRMEKNLRRVGIPIFCMARGKWNVVDVVAGQSFVAIASPSVRRAARQGEADSGTSGTGGGNVTVGRSGSGE
jgi:glycosyltransferase involved in cell wall biosynthesis